MPLSQRYAPLIIICSLLIGGCGETLDTKIPPAQGEGSAAQPLSWFSRAAMQVMFDFSVWSGNRSGYIAMFARDGQVVHATTAGWADIASQVPMQLDTRVRMASMTKPVTAVAAHILIEEGRLGLDDAVAKYIPAAANVRVATSDSAGADGEFVTVAAAPQLTVRHLLMFASGIGSGSTDSDLGKLWQANELYTGQGSLARRVDRILGLPLYEQPGEVWRYGFAADVLARVVEVAADESFAAFVTTRILNPLGMTSSSFLPPPNERQGMATVYTQDEQKNLVAVDEFKYDASDWAPGGSGLVSTAGDYMRFALMLWNQGSYNGVRILQPETVALMTQLHVPDGVLIEEGIEGLGWGLGVAVVADADKTRLSDRQGDFWWSGYSGTTLFVSPEPGLVAGV